MNLPILSALCAVTISVTVSASSSYARWGDNFNSNGNSRFAGTNSRGYNGGASANFANNGSAYGQQSYNRGNTMTSGYSGAGNGANMYNGNISRFSNGSYSNQAMYRPNAATTTNGTNSTTSTASTAPVAQSTAVNTTTANATTGTTTTNPFASQSMHQLVGQDDRISGQEQWINNQLSSGNLTAQQQSYLQNRLTQLQGAQTNINSALGTDLTNKQTQLQNLLSSGNLSASQQAAVQARLTQMQSQQQALTAGTNPFYNQGMTTGTTATTGTSLYNQGTSNTTTANVSSITGAPSFGQLIRHDDRISGEEQYIQNQLSTGNLTSQQQAWLQNRLTQLQSRQTNLNSALSTDLANKQAYLQNQLSSGNLTAAQQAALQNRLTQIQSQQTSLTAGTNPFYNPSGTTTTGSP